MSDTPAAFAMRILDANANRAREALRVLEDYARFALNHPGLCGELKSLRHGLTHALSGVLADAIVYRDTAGDVGTTNKTSAELHREDLAHVVTAAGKRLGEALRVLEEIAKTEAPDAAAQLESLRYRFYVLEQTLALTLRPTHRLAHVRLYVLITEAFCLGGSWLEVARQAIAGGADCLQLREKTVEGGELLRRARQLVALCRQSNVLCIVNDRADVAVAADADGVHVGQGDMPVREARRIVGRGRIVGVSTHNIEQARQAVLDGADYIGVGPVFPSPTKPRDFLPGLDYARQAAAEIRVPTVAIAGITAANVSEVAQTGVRAIAVTQAATAQADVTGACRALKRALCSG